MKTKLKKGELTTTQLITIIILILSFAIIVIFFFSLNLGGTIDRESCRNSVALRGTFSLFGGSLIKLKCQTQDVCFSMGGDCKADSPEITKIEITGETALFREMASLLADCWWMMGQGTVSYGDSGSCAICYNVYFDENIQKNLKINNTQFYNFMTRQMPNQDESYLSYLYEVNSIEALKVRMGSKLNLEENIDLTKPYIIVTSIVEEDHLFNPPILLEFSSNKLKNEFGCSKYVTEI